MHRTLLCLIVGFVSAAAQTRRDSVVLADSLFKQGHRLFTEKAFAPAGEAWDAAFRMFETLGEFRAALSVCENLALMARIRRDTARYEYYLGYQLDLARRTQNGRATAAALASLARSRADAYRLADADSLFRLALHQYDVDTTMDRREQANTLSNYATLCLRGSRFPDAVMALTRSIAMRRRINDTTGLASDLGSIGLAFLKTGRYDTAAVFIDEALAFNTRDPRLQARLLQYRGNLHDYLGDYDRAMDAYQQSFDLYQAIKDADGMADGYFNMGVVAHNRGDLQKALAFYKKSYEHHERTRALSPLARDWTNLGLVYRALNDLDQALACIQNAIKIERQTGDAQGLASDLVIQGMIAWQRHDTRLANDVLHEALEVYRGLGDLRGESNVLIQRAAIGLIQMEASSAADPEIPALLSRAADMKRRMADAYGEITALTYEGQYLRLTGQHPSALDRLNRALTLARSRNAVTLQWQILHALARNYDKMNRLAEAVEAYQNAILLIENQRVGLESEELRIGYFQDKSFVYSDLVDFLIRQKRPADALYYVESARGRSFLDILGSRALEKQNLPLLRRLDSIDARIGAFEKSIAQWELMASALEQDLQKLLDERTRIVAELEKTNQELSSIVSVAPMRTAEIQSLLEPDQALLEYFVVPQFTLLFVVTRERTDCHIVQETTARLLIDALEFRENLLKPGQDRYRTAGRRLYDLLIAPVETSIAGKRLVVVPHGKLHYIPFGALIRPSGDFLIDAHTVSYMPSASLLKFLNAKRKTPSPLSSQQLLAVANPVVPNLNALPAAESEVAHIGSLFSRSDVLVQTAATESAVRARAAGADVLHFACHGRFDFDRPQLSALHFSPDAQHDGSLTVSEIFALDLNRARLVVLSACETGLSKIVKGDELIGFSRAFIYAGAPSLISSLWPVSDESTSEMMKMFYSSLDHDAKDVALSKAQIEVRKRFPHPYFWSAFVLVGDWHR